MVRLKLAVTSTKHRIGVVLNRNINEGGVVWIFGLVGGLLGLEKAYWRLEDGELLGIRKSASNSRLEWGSGVCFV
jgi:hypothetical protein